MDERLQESASSPAAQSISTNASVAPRGAAVQGGNSTSQIALTNEQLLEYIRKQKLKIRKLEKEVEHLAASTTSSSSSNQLVSFSATTLPSETFDSSIFWDLLNRSPPFLKNLARSALASLVKTLSNSTLGRRKIPTKSNAFKKWKVFMYNHRFHSLQSAKEESSKTISLLEQRNTKLKLLLAKTHQANQRNMENSQTMKKAQRDALLELKHIKQRDESERTRLMETLRLQSMESAFHSDLEISIQKAADELLMQHQKLLQQKQIVGSDIDISQNGDPVSMSDNYNKKLSTSSPLSAPSSSGIAQGMIKISEMEVEIEALRKQVDALETERSSQHHYIQDLIGKCRAFEHEAQVNRNKADEEENQRKDLEVEIQILLANRDIIMKELNAAAEENAQKRNLELLKEVVQLTNKIASEEAEKNAIQERMYKAESDLEALRAINKRMLDQSEEVNRLQNIISDLKGLKFKANSGSGGDSVAAALTALTGSSNTASQFDTRSSKSKKNGCISEELISRIDELIDVSLGAARTCSFYAEIITDMEKQIKQKQLQTQEYLFHLSSLCRGFVSLIEESFFAGMFIKECSSIPQNVIQQRLKYKKSVEQSILDIDAKVLSLKVDSNMTTPLRNMDQPMIWEANSLTISPGRSVSILLPVSTFAIDAPRIKNGAKKTFLSLDWLYSGELAGNISITLCAAASSSQGGNDGFTLVSVPTPAANNKSNSLNEFSGRHQIPIPEATACDASHQSVDKVLTFHNNTMWTVKIAYKVTLSHENLVSESSCNKNLKNSAQEVDALLSRRKRLRNLFDRGSKLFELFVRTAEEACMTDKSEYTCNHIVDEALEKMTSASTNFLKAINKTNKDVNQQQLCRDLFHHVEQLGEKVKLILRASSDKTSLKPNSTSTDIKTNVTVPMGNGIATTGEGMQNKSLTGTHVGSESLIIRAADEIQFRLPLDATLNNEPVSQYLLIYEFNLPHPKQKGLDIGFAILEEMPDKSLPQIVPYRRVGASGLSSEVKITCRRTDHGIKTSNIVLLFDNSYSYFQSKEIRYRATLQPIHTKFEIEGECPTFITPSLPGTDNANTTDPLPHNDVIVSGARELIPEIPLAPSTMIDESIFSRKRSEILNLAREISMLLDEGVLLTAKRRGEL